MKPKAGPRTETRVACDACLQEVLKGTLQGQSHTAEKGLSLVCTSWVLCLQVASDTSWGLGVLPLPGPRSSHHTPLDTFRELIFHKKCTQLLKKLKILQFGVRNKY